MARSHVAILFFLLFVLLVVVARDSDPRVVIRIFPSSSLSLHTRISNIDGADFWSDRASNQKTSIVSLPLSEVVNTLGITFTGPSTKRRLRNMEDSSETEIEIVGYEEEIMRHFRESSTASLRDEEFSASYHTFEEIKDRVTDLVNSAPADLGAEMVQAGSSVEGRPIFSVEFGGVESNKAIVISCGVHAREWIGPAACIFMMEHWFSSDRDYQTRQFLSEIRIVMFPMVNPDGYEYSRTNDRWQRKNRRMPNNVDLNRNWDAHWGAGVRNPSSELYQGPAAFSEPEICAVRDRFNFLKNNGRLMLIGVDMHSFGQTIYRPYGWTTQAPPNNDQIIELCNRMVSAASSVHGAYYHHEAASEGGIAGAATDDWYTDNTLLQIGLTLEMRPTNFPPGFELPANQIVDASEEALAAVVAMIMWSMEKARLLDTTTALSPTTTPLPTLAPTSAIIPTQPTLSNSSSSDLSNISNIISEESQAHQNDTLLLEGDLTDISSNSPSFFSSRESALIAVSATAFAAIIIIAIGFVVYRRNRRLQLISKEMIEGRFRVAMSYRHPDKIVEQEGGSLL